MGTSKRRSILSMERSSDLCKLPKGGRRNLLLMSFVSWSSEVRLKH